MYNSESLDLIKCRSSKVDLNFNSNYSKYCLKLNKNTICLFLIENEMPILLVLIS